MKYLTIKPHPKLTSFVKSFWILECDVKDCDHFIYRSTADSCVKLAFHYKGRFDEITESGSLTSSFISGFHAHSNNVRRFTISQDFGIFGVYLYPFAVPALFNTPATAIAGQMVDIDNFGQEGKDIEDQIMLAESNAHRVSIISNFLIKKIERSRIDLKQFSPVKSIIDHKGQVNIQELADQHFISKRQMERNFKKFAGYSPKHFSRIVRFQSVFPHLKKDQHSLTEVAYLCGYSDQAHFIHDFKEFSGYNPREFLVTDSTETKIWV